MYYPYIFGRQYDLFSLDNVSDKIAKKKVVFPIIEPVVIKPRGLTKSLKILLSKDIPTIVIHNPDLGDFKGSTLGDKAAWDKEVAQFLADPNFVPAIKITTNTKISHIQSFLNSFNKKVALIHWGELDLVNLSAVLNSETNRIINVYMASHTSSSYRHSLPGTTKVLARDGFVKADRNADYANDEFFDDLILTHKTVEKMDGFSDFTITGSAFSSGGGPAAAVAIHLTYENPANKAIWIRHFVSDDVTIPPNDVNLKIGQSLRKIDNCVRANHRLFSFSDAVQKLQKLYSLGETTSLAKLKQISIEHHMELMDHLL